ncbi:MAG TPA: hypothetical protein PKW95_09945 [bacterium]|nr:hypothetical protein [bacterium]
MKSKLGLMLLMLVWLAALMQLGCPPDDDDDDDNDASPDDDSTDDDMIDDDTTDDDTTDDDTVDDDTTDDDTVDDDTTDDDTVDDDTVDDDTTDDDTTDDDTADDDVTDDPYVVTGVYAADLYADGHVPAPTDDATVTRIAGGAFGHYGVGLAVGAQLPSEMEQLVAQNVIFHATAKDENGHLYIAYITHADDGIRVANNASGSWSVEQATTQTGVQDLDLAVAGGAVHLSYNYYDGDDWYVHYLTNASGAWIDERMDDYSYNSSIVADAQGTVHILYNRTYSYSQLKYRTNSSGSWTTTAIGSAQWWFIDFDMFLDAQGTLHIAALDAIYGMVQEHFIYYASKGSGGWSFALAFHDYGFDYYIESLALLVDGAGTPHIAFASGGFYYLTRTDERAWSLTNPFDGERIGVLQAGRGGGNRLYYAYYNQSRGRSEVMARRGGAWERLPVESGGYVLANVDFAVDGDGHRHAVYYDCAGDAWMYATDATGQWTTEILCAEVGGDPYFYSTPSLAVDENGAAHVSYYHASTGQFRYATNATGAWVSQAVEEGSEAGYASSLVVDGEGRVHLAYETSSKGGVTYAVREDDDWTKTTIGEGGAYVDPISLARDGNGAAHIVYLANVDDGPDSSEQIRYATNASGEWVNELVYVDLGTTIIDVALALDDEGHARVAFPAWDYPDDTLLVASNAGGTWEIIDALGGVDSNYIYDVDIAIDAAGHTHILTGDQCSGDTCDRLAHLTDATGEWVVDYPAIAGTTGNSVALALSDAGLEAAYTGEFALWHLLLPW